MVSEKVHIWVGRGVASWDRYHDAMDGVFFIVFAWMHKPSFGICISWDVDTRFSMFCLYIKNLSSDIVQHLFLLLISISSVSARQFPTCYTNRPCYDHPSTLSFAQRSALSFPQSSPPLHHLSPRRILMRTPCCTTSLLEPLLRRPWSILVGAI
jgi:hypothetical protein